MYGKRAQQTTSVEIGQGEERRDPDFLTLLKMEEENFAGEQFDQSDGEWEVNPCLDLYTDGLPEKYYSCEAAVRHPSSLKSQDGS